MEELAEMNPSQNLNTQIKNIKAKLNALRTEEEAANHYHFNSTKRNNYDKKRGNLGQKLDQLQKNKTVKNRKNLKNTNTLDYIIVSNAAYNSELRSDVEPEIRSSNFESKVMKKISEGYVLQGGISTANGNFYQAMIKPKNNANNLLTGNANLLKFTN